MKIRVALIGPAGVGKTTWIRRLSEPFEPRYFPTEGKELHVVEIPGIQFLVTEYAGQEQFRGIPQEELDAITAYIVMTASKRDLKCARKLMRRMPKHIPYSFVRQDQDLFSVKDHVNLLAPFQDIALQLNTRSRL
jgi:GTPase SAR1 family protein